MSAKAVLLPMGAFLGRGGLLAEDLQHGFALSLIHLGKGLLNQCGVVKVAGVEHFREAEGRVAQENLGVLEPLIVVGHGQMDFMSQLLDPFQQRCGLVYIAGRVLAYAELGHLVH